MSRLIESRKVDWSPDLVKDPVQEALVETIETKKKRRKRKTQTTSEAAEPTGNVVSIMDALRKSVENEKRPKKG